MGRSLKKGPYVVESVYRKVMKQTEAGENTQSRPGHARAPLFLSLWVSHSRYIMAEHSRLYL